MSLEVTGAPGILDGKIVTPTDRRYSMVRSTYTSVNSPALVVLVENADDIVAALQLAADRRIEVTVRSGGHSLAGMSSNDFGMVIDLSRMNAIEVIDRTNRIVRIQAGARWGAVAQTLQPHGLAISSGNYGNVGVGGLATAGGIGWMVRKHGLTIDHLRAAVVVLADGTVVTANAQEHPELFWAIRGAGSMIGIVTDFIFEATEATSIVYTQVSLRLDPAAHPLQRWSEAVDAAPRELTVDTMIQGSRASITGVYAGTSPTDAAAAFEPFTKIATMNDTSEPQLVPYAALVPRAHEHPNVGQQVAVTHNGMLDAITRSDEDIILEAAASGVLMQLRSLGGAMRDIDADATAFANRRQNALVIATVFSPQELTRLDKYWAPLIPAFTGAYANFEAKPTHETTLLAFPAATLSRILQVKQRYDPNATFRSWPT